MVTVEESSDVAAFKDFTPSSVAQVAAAPKPQDTPSPPPAAAPSSSNPVPAASTPSSQSNARVFASPLARKLAKEKSIDISSLLGSGPKGRIVAADVLNQNVKPKAAIEAGKATSATPPTHQSTETKIPQSAASHEDMSITSADSELAAIFVQSKKAVPHYYLSVEINLSKSLQLREQLNERTKADIGLLDIIVKAAAMAVKQVPDVNASWLENFVRRYDQVGRSSDDVLVSVLISPSRWISTSFPMVVSERCCQSSKM
jgi:pyruvate dehydrogenase E2 component (dihydrolipoamide acetyltransferase)